MQVVLGIDNSGKPLIWDPSQTVNPHVIVTGVTGSGKTHTIREFIRQIVKTSRYPVRIHVFDQHDDIEVHGSSDLIFSQNTTYGFNPLVIDPDEHSGGVRRSISNFLSLLAKTANYKMGDRQEAVLRSLLTELYELKGFFADNPNSWRLDDGYKRRTPKAFPTVKDLYFYAKFKNEKLFMGGDSIALTRLRDAAKASQKLVKAAKSAKSMGESIPDNTDVIKAAMAAKSAYDDYFDSILKGTGRELDSILQYQSKDVLASVVDRLGKLHHFGVFSGEMPPFDPNAPVWRYRLNNLSRDEALLFIHTVLSSIFYAAKRRGITDHVQDIVVIDEAKLVTDDSPDNITNIISAEARKFGLMQLLASQTHAHFSIDNIQAAATSILLRQDSSFYSKLKNLTGVDINEFTQITPKKSALIRMVSAGVRNDNYQHVNVVSSNIAKFEGPSSPQQPTRTPPNHANQLHSSSAQTAKRPSVVVSAAVNLDDLDLSNDIDVFTANVVEQPTARPSTSNSVTALLDEFVDEDVNDGDDEHSKNDAQYSAGDLTSFDDPFAATPKQVKTNFPLQDNLPDATTGANAEPEPSSADIMKKIRSDMLL